MPQGDTRAAALMGGRVPPHHMEAEQSVLGAILIDNQVFFKVIDSLKPEDFYRPAHGKIFSAMVQLATKNQPIDVVTLTAKMKEMGIHEEVGGASFLADILERVPTAFHAEYHAKIVADAALKRRLISVCHEVGSRGFEPQETTEELLDFAEKEIFGLAASKRQGSVAKVSDIIKDAFAELERRYELQEAITGVPTGYVDLDKMTQGLQPSDLVIVACRPSMGKTSFSLGLARNAGVHAKVPVAFFSLEMSKEQIVTRLLAAEAKVDSTRIRTGRLTDEDWGRLTHAAGILADSPLYIDDTPALSVLEVRGKSRRLQAEVGKLGVIIIDYLQIMGSGATGRGMDNREKVISDISRSLKALAKELHVPVVALSQLNRNIDLRQDKRPMMADLRESGAIEQDADLIVFIHRDDVENQNPQGASVAEFIVGKHRNGPRGTVKVAWLGQYACFENLVQGPAFPVEGSYQ